MLPPNEYKVRVMSRKRKQIWKDFRKFLMETNACQNQQIKWIRKRHDLTRKFLKEYAELENDSIAGTEYEHSYHIDVKSITNIHKLIVDWHKAQEKFNGKRVKANLPWIYGDCPCQGGPDPHGLAVAEANDSIGWIHVIWDNGHSNSYRISNDTSLTDISKPDIMLEEEGVESHPSSS